MSLSVKGEEEEQGKGRERKVKEQLSKNREKMMGIEGKEDWL